MFSISLANIRTLHGKRIKVIKYQELMTKYNIENTVLKFIWRQKDIKIDKYILQYVIQVKPPIGTEYISSYCSN